MNAEADSALARKLLIKPAMSVLVLDSQPGYEDALQPLPEGARISQNAAGQHDVVQLFPRTKSDVDRLAPVALQALKPGGVLWASFPKGSSKIQTDLTRDRGWDAFRDRGWRIVTVVSLDDTWSAGRFRPE